MAANRYTNGGWAEGFNSTRDALRGFAKDQELEADASAPDPTVDPGRNLGLISVANPNNMGPQQSEVDGGERVEQPNVVVQAPAQSPGLSNVAAGAARAQRRANIYRRYGEDADADKLLSNDASLGLVAAQTRGHLATADLEETKAADARRTSADAQAVHDVNQEVAQQMKDGGVDTSTAEGGVKANRALIDGLFKRGMPGAAKDAAERQLAMQTGAVKSQTERRQVAANAIVMGSRAGTLTPEALGAFHDEFIPDGSKVRSTTINKDGGFTMILADSNGKESTQTVAGANLSNMYGMLGSADASAAIIAQLEAKAKLALHEAQAKHALAGARASDAAAGTSAAHTADIKQTTAQKAIENKRGNDVFSARQAENSEAGSTDEQFSLIGAADDTNISRRARVNPGDSIPMRAAKEERISNSKLIDQLAKQLETAAVMDKARVPGLRKQMEDAEADGIRIRARLRGLQGGMEEPPGLSTVVTPPAAGASAPPAGSAPPSKRPALGSFQR